MKYEPRALYNHTEIEEIQEWLEACEDQMDDLSKRDQEFLDSIRLQFNERVKMDDERPLTGKQLVALKTIFDKL